MTALLPLLDTRTAALAPFVAARALDAADVHVTATIARVTGETDPEVLLAVALAVRAPRVGHVCIVPAEIAATIVLDEADPGVLDALPWPDPARWHDRLAASPAVRTPADEEGDLVVPLVLDGPRLYLDRYWRFERRVADDLVRRAGAPAGLFPLGGALAAALDAAFGTDDPSAPDLQRRAAAVALTRRLAVVAGGPGTGKTRTVARLLAAAHELALDTGHPLDVALAAPTGKAAARLTEAVHHDTSADAPRAEVAAALLGTEASTIHRLLGASTGGRFRHGHADPLPHDLVVIDETSMVSLPLMARLLDAVRPDATLVLVGDPFQLASVEAGAVLGEVVGPAALAPAPGALAPAVVLLERVHRFRADSAIAALADGVRTGDADHVIAVLRAGGTDVAWVDGDDEAGVTALAREAAGHATEVVGAARAGDAEAGLAAASDFKVLTATRYGPLGTYRFTDRIESLAAAALPDAGIGRRWYVGRPVIVTRNDYANRLFNGDVGLAVAGPDGRSSVAFPVAEGVRRLAPSQLADLETWWAMTIHKSQGSEFRRVVVCLPAPPSPILTRELLYTAITRAKEQVTVVASEASLRAAIARPVARASGLRARLWPGEGPGPAR